MVYGVTGKDTEGKGAESANEELGIRNFVYFLSRRKPSAKADALFCGYLP